MALSKEEMRLYQRARRAKLKVAPVCASCELLREQVARLEKLLQPVKQTFSATYKSEESIKPKVQDWRKDKVVGCRKFGE
jgi:hypothetical protein